MAFTGQIYGNGTSTATNGSNVRVDYYDRAAIKVAVDDLIYGRYVDSKTQKRNSGKTFRISRFHHILDDANVNNQGLDGNGDVIGNTSYIYGNVAYANLAAANVVRDAELDDYDVAILVTANATAGTDTLTIVSYVDAFTGATIADATVEILRTTFEAQACNTAKDDAVDIVLSENTILEFNKLGDVIDVTNGGGNLYGSSRNVGDVVSAMPLLSEGADRVNRVGITRENFSATLVRQGNFEEYTDEVTMFSDQDMQMEYRTKLARLAIETKDDNNQLGMLGAAGVRFYAGTATSIASIGESNDAGTTQEACRPTYDFFRKIVKRLKINLAKKNTSMITGSTKVGTTPINSAYYAIVGPDVTYDLEGITEFKAVHEYGYANGVPDNEIGSIHETRFIETNRAMKYAGKGATVATDDLDLASTGSNLDVFPILYPTQGSYASVGLQGAGAIKFKSKAPGVATSEDPYGVKGLFSYNYWYAGLALQPEKLLVAYVGASA